MKVIWCMVPEILSMTGRIFCHFGPFFALLAPNNTKKQNFEKIKKSPGDVLILHMCTINESHMMYGSWDIECNRQNYLSFWTVPDNPKNQNFEKLKKKHLETSSLYTSVAKIMIICYTVPWIWHITDLFCFFISSYFLPFYLPNSPKNKNLEKMKKKPGDIIILQ